MEFFKDRNRWTFVLGFFYVVAIFASGLSLSVLQDYNGEVRRENIAVIYAGLSVILLTGTLSAWLTWNSRKEVMAYHEKGENFSMSPSPLAVNPKMVNSVGTDVKTRLAYKTGHHDGLTIIYSQDRRIRYISPTAESMLGYSQIELIGGSDLENVHPDHRAAFSYVFTRLKENPHEKVKLQYAYKTKDGNYIWLESTCSNNISDPDVNGFLVKTTDTTASRLEHQANRMRTKIQALSENSPDLIIRLEHGTITYINPVIEYYTGKGSAAYLNKKTSESGLDVSILESWSRIVDQVSESGGKMILEMDFPCAMGQRIMQVHAIPEYGEDEILESVLVVSHDITERKKIEREVNHQHKKITESINYAKRIQGAILPNPRLIDRALPNSFILYKPRDQVSGDFPWFAQVKEEIFMAAVDCTGHGVPGALLSLVGYFLLNDIVRSRRITEPGQILDLLDEGVATTLRPDEDAGTKDGMDLGLCRINMEEKELVFAGAHRPLFIVRSGNLEEIKGNRFPIGGGIFKNQTSFTSTRIKLNHGDAVYFCTDGYCDQFGGPHGRKFGTKQLRDIIMKLHSIPMKEAKIIFEDQWEAWKGDQKQTDDVLLIGIRF